MPKKTLDHLTEDELLEELARRKAERLGDDVTAIEDEIDDAAELVKQAILDQRLASLPEEDDRPKRCPRCGRMVRVRRRKVERTVRTRSGTLKLSRNYHYCGHCSSGFFPRDRELGLPEEGSVSFGLEKRILDFGINDTFEEAASRWSLHYGWPISENLVRRVVDRVGKRIEYADDTYLQHALSEPESRKSKLVLVQNDGSMLPTHEGWKEAKVGVIVRQEHHSSYQQVGRGHVSEARYVAVLGGQEEFKTALDKALRVERARKAGRIVWLADGALGNWRLANDLAPGCIKILDWYHAVEAAMDCAKALLWDCPELQPLWYKVCCRLLIHGQVETLLEQLMECMGLTDQQGLVAINDLVRYYRNNRLRMNYPQYLRDGLPIGNGVAESSHRHVLQVRMKRAGQRWSLPKGRRMARLRAAYRKAGPGRLHRAIRIAAEATRVAALPQRQRLRASNR
ncbi:ISKra4 family transposase [Myxococcota bacterium]